MTSIIRCWISKRCIKQRLKWVMRRKLWKNSLLLLAARIGSNIWLTIRSFSCHRLSVKSTLLRFQWQNLLLKLRMSISWFKCCLIQLSHFVRKLINFSLRQYRSTTFEMFSMLSSLIFTAFLSSKSKKKRRKSMIIVIFAKCQIIEKEVAKNYTFW